ncbi:MAG TPA: hypothetical protein DIT04_08320 [Dysgonomonas sp.]|nr:hypothetical protein [Dysgonomonas sp.]
MAVPSYETYVINLDRAKDRLEMMEKEFSQYSMSFERIEAVDAKNLEKYDYIVKNKYDRDLVPGEIACSLSHIKAIKTFYESGKSFGLILEDDAVLCDDFRNVVENCLLSYYTLPEKHRWDILKFCNVKRRRHIKLAEVYKDYFLAACGTSIPINTIAAIWTREAARKFLDKISSPVPVVRMPIDCELQFPWQFNLRIYNILPSPVRTADSNTQIHSATKDRKAKLSRQILYEAKRVFPKYYYLISHHGIKEFYNSFIAKKTPRIS